MSKLKRHTDVTSAPVRLCSHGPLFVLVREDRPEHAKPYYILAKSNRDPLPEEVRSTAEKIVKLHASANRGVRYHWERLDMPERDPDAARGRVALDQAKRNILSGPDSPGKRFLQGLGRGRDLFPKISQPPPEEPPPLDPEDRYNNMLSRLQQDIPPAEGPGGFDPDNDPSLQGDL